MLKHIVLLPLESTVKPRMLEEIFDAINELKKLLPGIMSLAYGKNWQDEGQKEQGYTHAYSMDFVDEEYYRNFIEHEKHTAVQEKIKELLATKRETLIFNYNLT